LKPSESAGRYRTTSGKERKEPRNGRGKRRQKHAACNGHARLKEMSYIKDKTTVTWNVTLFKAQSRKGLCEPSALKERMYAAAALISRLTVYSVPTRVTNDHYALH
jgi:hypothetical protein